MAIDLHTHTTFSDGSLTPQELVQKANDFRITAIAITDHDEIRANNIAIEYSKNLNLEVVPGAEFSIDIALEGKAHLHLLGLFLDFENEELNVVLDKLRKARKSRSYEIISKLKNIGIDVSNEEVDLIVGEGSAGRPHIAKLLLNKGIVTSIWEAFNKYLSKDKPAYVSKKKLGLIEAIDLIHKVKGLSVLAHPISLKHKQYRETDAFLRELKDIGLDGIEAYYPTHSRSFTNFLIQSSSKNNLLISGGSDFHGSTKPDTELGRGKGNLNIPDSVFDNLKNALK